MNTIFSRYVSLLLSLVLTFALIHFSQFTTVVHVLFVPMNATFNLLVIFVLTFTLIHLSQLAACIFYDFPLINSYISNDLDLNDLSKSQRHHFPPRRNSLLYSN